MMSASSEPESAEVDGCSRALESVTLEPRGSDWLSLLKRTPPTVFQKRLREQLALPTDRPIIMSGHQAELWHPGILAKWFAGAALARRVGAVFVWLHVDQDTNEPGVIAVPALDASGALVKRTLSLIDPAREIPTGTRPAVPVAASAARLAHGEALVDPEPVSRLIHALNRHADQPTLALQFGRAAEALAGAATTDTPPALAITTSQLAATDAFAAMVDLLRRDPARAIEAHNRAASRIPEAGIRALGLKRSSPTGELGSPPRVELPLWRVTPGVPRTPVMLSQLESIPPSELRPRALLMTGLARLGACDLFIHGTGGGVYDRITDAWFSDWLQDLGPDWARESLPLAPTVVATATAHLTFDARHGGVDLKTARAASHLAHHARHNPGLLDDPVAARTKHDLVERIARSTDRAVRAALFQEMHALLARVRAASDAKLTAMDRHAAAATRRAAEQAVVTERTWPFPLYPDATLALLRARIDREFGS